MSNRTAYFPGISGAPPAAGAWGPQVVASTNAMVRSLNNPLTAQIPGGTVNAAAWPYNADLTGAKDSTAAIQAALDSLTTKGGAVWLPAGTYKILGTLVWPAANGISMMGGSQRPTTLLFDNGTADCIRIAGADAAHQIVYAEISNVLMECFGKTGGRAFDIAFAASIRLINVVIDHPFCGIELWQTNDVLLNGVRMYGITGGTVTPPHRGSYDPGACYGVFYHGPGDVTNGRSDGLTCLNTLIDCAAGGSDGLLVDGAAFTINIYNTATTAPRDGLRITNGSGIDTTIPQFGVFDNFVVDTATNRGAEMLTGYDFRIDQSQICANGTTGTYSLVVAGGSNLTVQNSRLLANDGNAVFIDTSKYVKVLGCDLASGMSGANPNAAVAIGSGAADVIISGNQTSNEIAFNNWAAGCAVANGSTDVNVIGNNFLGCTDTIDWLNTDPASQASGNAPGFEILPLLGSYANDAAAAIGGVFLGALYWGSGVNAVVQRRV